MEIDELNKIIKGCKKCGLSKTRMNAICGEGNLNAKIMLIAQAPGEKEDREGKMFVGPSGKVLDIRLLCYLLHFSKIWHFVIFKTRVFFNLW